MGIPVAVAPSVHSPGLALQVNLLAGQSSPGTGQLKALLMCPKSSAGTITANTELKVAVAGADEVATLLGLGTPGHLAAKRAFEEYGLLSLDVIAPTVSVGATATGIIEFASSPTSARTVTAKIMGREVVTSWLAGETAIQGAAKLKDAINAQTDELCVTATNPANPDDDQVLLTFKVPGPMGNDCKYSVVLTDGAGGTATAAGAKLGLGSGATLGTTEPSFATALLTIQGKEYDYILPCVSNADAELGTSSSNPGRVATYINNNDSGFNAKLQQEVVGLSGNGLSAAKTGAAAIMGQGPGISQYIFCNNGQSLPCELGGLELGARVREESADPAANRINMIYRGQFYGAADLSADALTDVQVEDALQSGVTPVTYDASGNERPSRPITTYFKDSAGNPDDRILDTSRVTGTYAVAKDLRIAIPREFEGAKLSKDLLPGDDELPEGVVEERDVKSFVNYRVRFFIARGVVQRAKYEAALADGTFLVRVNPSDPGQCDIVLPLSIVPPLAKFSLVVNHTGPS